MFHSGDFSWDWISNEELGLCLISFDDDVLNDYGFAYSESLKTDNTYNDNPYYFKEISEVDEITLNFCLVDSNSIPITWEDYTVEEICNIFMTSDFKPFVSYDNLEYVYYLKATKIVKKFTIDKKGYLEITFQPYTNYAYKKYKKQIAVNDSVDTYVINYSNIKDTYKPILEITNLGDETTVNTIQNLSIAGSEKLEITGLKNGEKIIIDNLYYTVLNEDGINRFLTCNRKWIELLGGSNKLSLKGNFNLTVKAEYPIIT